MVQCKSDDVALNIWYLILLMKAATLEARFRTWLFRQKYSSDQPRVPAGNPDGGQWTDGDGGYIPKPKPRQAQAGNDVTGSNPEKPVKNLGRGVEKIKENAAKLREKLKEQGKPYLYGAKRCGEYVRLALEAAGFKLPPINDGGHGYAKNFGPALEAIGFSPIFSVDKPSIYPPVGYIPQAGDVMVMDTYERQSIPAGHIAMFTGYRADKTEAWYSDFDQPQGFWAGPGYREYKPKYTIYRYATDQ